MTLLIILLAACLVLGSAMWVLPSPKEKRQMLLRRHAMSKGIQVQLSKLQNPKNPMDKIHCIAYRLPIQHARKENKAWLLYQPEMSLRSHVNGWSFAAHGSRPDEQLVAQLKPLVEKLPKDTLAIERTPVSVGLYWQERGGTEDVDAIQQILHTMQSL